MLRSAHVVRFVLCVSAVFSIFSLSASAQQAPLPMPFTMSTIAGSAPMTPVAGTPCPTLNAITGAVSTDAFGDGCLAVNGIFGAAARGGVQVDAFGNIFVADDINSIIHVINPITGIMTAVAGGASAVCTAATGPGLSGSQDAAGDGCLAATQTKAAGQRGIGIDPYGNIFLAGFSDNMVHIVCRTTSPLCTSGQIGTMRLIAGCVKNATSNGTGGVGLDNVQAAQTFVTAGCTTANGEVDAPRGVSADQYGNVYFADTTSSRTRVVVGPLTSTFFVGNNPVYAALGTFYASVTQGFAYTVVNISGTSVTTGGTPTVQGATCSNTVNSITYTGTALDTLGDGCPLNFSSVDAASGLTSGVAMDAAGNMLFTDPTHGLRVLFVGGTSAAALKMRAAIITNNPGVTPQVGFIYLLWGGGATTLAAAPTLGTSTKATDTTLTKVNVSPQGNVYVGDSSKVVYYDMNTGFVRLLFTGSANVTAGNFCSGTSGQKSLSAFSDGCAASQSIFSNANGLGLAADAQNNLYLFDATSNATGMLVRKVLAQGFGQRTVGTPAIQNFQVHISETTTGAVSAPTATLTTTPDATAGTVACGAQNLDNSFDCNVSVTATPTAAGLRSATLTVSVTFTPTAGSPATSSAIVALSGTATGSVLAFDSATSTNGSTTNISPTTNTFFSGITPAGTALDGAGNIYTMDTTAGQILEFVQGTGSAAIAGTLPTGASQIAVDPTGNVFAVGSGSPTITELAVTGAPSSPGHPATFTGTTVSYTPISGTATPQAIAADAAGNLFIADKQGTTANTAIYKLSLVPNSLAPQITVATGFTNPVSIAVDPYGNVYVADSGVGFVFKLTPGLVSGVPGYVQTTVSLPGALPVAVAVDPAGDLYVQDSISHSVIEVPVSGPNTTVLTGLVTPTGVGVDGNGNVYSADSNSGHVTQVVRSQVAFSFGSSISTTLAGTLTNVGSQNVTGSNTATDTSDFAVVGGASSPCNFTTSVLGAQAVGNACKLSATFTPQIGTGTVSEVLSYLPAASTIGSLTMTAIKTGGVVTTSTTIGGETPASPVFVAIGTTVTFTVNVAASSGTASGTVNVTVDSGAANGFVLDPSGNATVPLAGLTAGSHTIAASYATQNGFSGSNSTTTSFSVAKATTGVTWTPGALTQQFSQAIGAGVLNAAVTPLVAGNFTYTATPSGGSPAAIDASSYLPIGTYSLAVTFTPVDLVDFVGATGSVASYSVTKANTTAGVGASNNVVAADGTGNFTSLTAALVALPVTGGTIYLKPGTYTGQNAISYPNVSLRGLGGDPTKVIITGEDGAFSAPFVYPGSGPGNANASGDQGSSTLDVSKSAFIGNQPTSGNTTFIPVGFYAEYLTVQNTYNTDTTTTSTFSTAGSGSCANTGTALTLQALYNSGTQCNSQALALWITADQAILNHVNLQSQQDTLFAGSQGCSTTCTAARQYMWQGTITGDVDYVFGDAAMVYDHTTFFTTWHGNTATGTETIEAQNKKFQTGSANDYLSGYICNTCTFYSQSTGMTNLFYGRPFGPFSTWIMLNSNVDQVNAVGWIEFQGDINLPTSTYAEFGSVPLTDPVVGTGGYPATLPGNVTPTGGNTGTGVIGVRETESQNPGTIEAGNAVKTSLTAAQAAQYFPVTFLGTTVPTQTYIGFQSNWNPVTALANAVNAFAPTGSLTVNQGSSVTIVGRPVTPGAGVIPTGTYQFLDGGSTVLASGTLDVSGEANLTTKTLSVGTHTITMTYGGDANFNASASSATFTIHVTTPLISTTSVLSVTNSNSTYGTSVTGLVSVTQGTGSVVPTGTVSLLVDAASAGSCVLTSGACTFSLTGVKAGSHIVTANYGGDSTNATSASNAAAINVGRSILQVTANNIVIVFGQVLPAYSAAITGFVNGDTAGSAVTGAAALSTNPTVPSAIGIYPISASTGTLAANNYTFTFTNGELTIASAVLAPPVATGDSRTVVEPSFPAVCTTLTAALTSVNDDIPTSVDAVNTNPDGARIQAALNACGNTNQAVRLSIDGAGHNAYLTGPLNMPSGVTLLVDPGVFVYFSRNVQDYDVVPGTHTCGTVNNNSATSSCLPLINIAGVSNVGIMGFGKLDGRGGDVLINAFPASFAGQSWWGLSAIANSGGSQQNPRFIQLGNPTNVTLYKITLKNSPLFHVSSPNGVNGLTAWDVKIVTPTSARNTDGIDPDQAQNVTITRSWISDGDDNVAVGASGSASSASANISVTNNHFFAGHGESIGSFTSAGVSNILFDNNMLSGNSSVDSNSEGIRIKSADDRGGVVQNIQYSNSCFQNHKAEVEYTTQYNTNPGTLSPSFKNILLQNLTFLTAGTVGFTGAQINGSPNSLIVTLDNVSFASLPTNDITPAPTQTQLTYGPGQVSSNFVTDLQPFIGVNGNTLTDNRTAASLVPPTCNFTNIAPELTGPTGLPQSIIAGQTATAIVILTPAIGGSAYPTGTVTLSDGAGSTTTVTLPGTGDTISIPLTGLSVGQHTFVATYSGDANYVPTVGGTPYSTTNPYIINVSAGSLSGTTTALSGVPVTATFGTTFTATATVNGSSPSGSVQFIVNGIVFATSSVNAGTAQASIGLPLGAYTISAVYDGDGVNASSTSTSSALTITPALTSTALAANINTTTLGVPVTLTATVTSVAGIPAGTVTFTYTTTINNTPTVTSSATLTNGVAISSVDLPIGVDSVTATYAASGSFAGSSSAPPITITVNPPVLVPLPSTPMAMPFTMTTLAGGSTVANANTVCAGSTDSFGDGCLATAMVFNGTVDLRSVVADPFGNVYLTDANASLVRKISPNGIITNFVGFVSGTSCLPSATVGCAPTQVKLNKPRGVTADALGNIYIAGFSDNKVYEYNASSGLVFLVAGSGTRPSVPSAPNGDGGSAVAAQINQPRGVWPDSVGNIYVADTADNKIRVVNSTGNIQTLAGTGTTASTGDGGLATAAAVNNPQAVMTDANDNVYISEASRVRVVCVTCTPGSPLYLLLNKLGIATPQNGFIYTLAGGGAAAYAGPALANTITMSPQKLAIDADGDLYVSDGTGAVWFVDSRTAFIRPIAGNTATNCAGATDAFGDGCPATQAIIGNGGNGIGVGTDTLGNIYISDTLNLRIRKVTTNLNSPATATAATATQPVQIHFVAGDSPATTNALTTSGTEWQLGAPSCATNTDTTVDCMVNSSFTPAVPGARSSALAVNSSGGNKAFLALTGVGRGSGATLDPASQSNFGANLQVTSIATDSSGNIYVGDAKSKSLLRFAAAAVTQGASATSTTLATVTAPGPVAVDGRGFAYVADTSTGMITQVSPGGAIVTLPFKFTTPAGMTIDSLNNIYVSDAATKAVYELSPITGAQITLATSALVSPAGLAIDPNGNLLITDAGAPAIYRFNLQSGVTTPVTSTAVAPSGIAVDAAGNLLIADSASILAIPSSANSGSFKVASLTPSALAIDSAGNLYTGSGAGVLKLTRTQAHLSFLNPVSAPQTVTLLESGNQAAQFTSVGQTDSTDFNLTAAASTDCTLTGALPSAVAVGGVCAVTASFTPTTFANPTDTATFNGNIANAALSTPASVQLLLTGPTVAPASAIVLGPFVPPSPIVGQSVTVTATVSGAAITPTGTVVFTVDTTTTSANLINGIATATLTGLIQGTHTVSAAYTSTNGFAPSSTSPATLTVGLLVPTITTLSPTSAITGGAAFTLTVNGTNFVTGAVVKWNTTSLTTTFVSATQLTAAVTASLLSTGGAVTITVVNPPPGGGTSTGATFNVTDFTLTSTSGTQSVAAGGSATFSINTSAVAGTLPVTVSFTASGLPLGATGTFSPAAVTAGGSTSLTITTSARTSVVGMRLLGPGAHNVPQTAPTWLAISALALLLAGIGFATFNGRPLRRFAPVAALILLIASTGYLAGCMETPIINPNGTPSGNYTIVVTATSGTDVHTTSVLLTVN
jgi:sugar lactone lactonase YvrE